MASSLVDPIAVENLHQSLLTALRSGTAPWFGDVLRDYDDVGDLTIRGRRKMPAMMRGADGQLPDAHPPPGRPHPHAPGAGRSSPSEEGEAMSIEPTNLTAQLHHRAAGNPPSTLPDSAISNCFPGLEFDFRNVWRRAASRASCCTRPAASSSAPSAEHERLAGRYLVPVADFPTLMSGARPATASGRRLGSAFMEWSNALADVRARASSGERVRVRLLRPAEAPTPAETVAAARAADVRAQRGDQRPDGADRRGARAAGRADAEPLLAVAERLPRVRLLLLGRQPARTTSTSSRRRAGAIGNKWLARSREPKTYGVPGPDSTRSSSASGRACCASSSAARMPTEGRPCGARRRA